ncbi:MAG: hypothetical protein AMXMBFR82_28510 [Candidatus Hydrogenedentota bacterium]
METYVRIAIVAAAIVGVAIAETQIEELRPATRDVAVDVTNTKGSVDILGWEQAVVEVTGKLGSDSDVLEFSGTEDRLTIRVSNPNKRPKEASLLVRVPFGATVQVECVSAKIEVEDVEGGLDLRTVSGKVEALQTAGRVRAETVSGSLEVEGRPTSVEAKTVSGKVDIMVASNAPLRSAPDDPDTVRTRMERIAASTVSGSIDIESVDVELLQCETVSGSVDFIGAIAANGEAELQTHSGSIDIVLPAGSPVSLDLNTFSGGIDSDFGGEVNEPKFGPGRSLEYVAGSGAARVRARSFSGSVSVIGR